jgi:hypothetical protein
MEINITRFVINADPFDFSASRAERGDNAGRVTWNNAKAEGESSPLLITPEQLEALRDHVRGYGAWDKEEIAAWSDAECNALFIQLISGDMREAGMDECDIEDFDWYEYQQGSISGRIYKGDDNQIYFYLGD